MLFHSPRDVIRSFAWHLQIEFEGYVAAGTVMKSYIAILTLLLRLRQASLGCFIFGLSRPLTFVFGARSSTFRACKLGPARFFSDEDEGTVLLTVGFAFTFTPAGLGFECVNIPCGAHAHHTRSI